MSAPARTPLWYPIPFDEGVPRGAPACADGDEILCRVDGEAIACTVERRHGCRFVGDDGEDYSHRADAIAHPLPRQTSGPTRTRAERREAGWKRLDVLVDERTLGRLDAIREAEGGISRAEMVRTIIDAAWGETQETREFLVDRPDEL